MVHPCWGLPCFQECCFVVISSIMFVSLILENSSHPKYANSVADALFISLQNARIIPTEQKTLIWSDMFWVFLGCVKLFQPIFHPTFEPVPVQPDHGNVPRPKAQRPRSSTIASRMFATAPERHHAQVSSFWDISLHYIWYMYIYNYIYNICVNYIYTLYMYATYYMNS